MLQKKIAKKSKKGKEPADEEAVLRPEAVEDDEEEPVIKKKVVQKKGQANVDEFSSLKSSVSQRENKRIKEEK